jgi:hypothetical protein
MRCLKLPNEVLLAWRNRLFIHNILPSNSFKKRIIKLLFRLPILNFFSSGFDGKLNFYGSNIDVFSVASELIKSEDEIRLNAVFFNATRDRQRVYVWGDHGSKPFFIKIGQPDDYDLFENEHNACGYECKSDHFRILQARSIIKKNKYSAILLEGLSFYEIDKMKRISGLEFLKYCVNLNLDLKNIFKNRAHGDLSSNNIYRVEGKVIIMDWEFSAKNPPDYCDVIEIFSSDKKYQKQHGNKISLLLNDIKRGLDIDIGYENAIKSLKFLAISKKGTAKIFLRKT